MIIDPDEYEHKAFLAFLPERHWYNICDWAVINNIPIVLTFGYICFNTSEDLLLFKLAFKS
jgi:hypothetical protein